MHLHPNLCAVYGSIYLGRSHVAATPAPFSTAPSSSSASAQQCTATHHALNRLPDSSRHVTLTLTDTITESYSPLNTEVTHHATRHIHTSTPQCAAAISSSALSPFSSRRLRFGSREAFALQIVSSTSHFAVSHGICLKNKRNITNKSNSARLPSWPLPRMVHHRRITRSNLRTSQR